MVLSNGSKNARSQSSIVNRNQGGGNKKAGFPYQVGRSSWSSVAIDSAPSVGPCCKLTQLQVNLFPNAKLSRPIGSTYVPNRYFTVPGTR